MNMKTAAFNLKGNLFTSILIEVLDAKLETFLQLLDAKIASAPAFFLNSPVILDFSKAQLDQDELMIFKQQVVSCGLVPIGIRGITDTFQLAQLGLPLMPESMIKSTSLESTVSSRGDRESIEDKPKSEQSQPVSQKTETRFFNKTQYVETPVRSGQQIFAQEANLVVLANINEGAEIIADGDIHIYGALRGRALAGVRGNTSARIFCSSLEAELVSVAGVFKLADDIKKSFYKKSSQIYLSEQDLIVKAL